MFDRLLIRFYPLFNFTAIIGMLCGIAFIGMGIAGYFDKIDMGRSFEKIDPIWMIAGGLGIVLTFWLKRSKIKAGVDAANERKG
ncbi:hypothetical protein [Profundibacter sp.]|uniref:hypothetical protein n=1 Tax=Profundibacter sp. TaxID=3101071 RepID=UPI003D133D36